MKPTRRELIAGAAAAATAGLMGSPARARAVLSDDAGQFAVGRHALCWVHAERLVHKLEAFTDRHRAAQQRIRVLIWDRID